MFIQTEATPNPATLKFLPGRTVLGNGTFEARDAEEAGRSPLAARLFEIPGVTGVFFGSDFVTVTKGAGEWPHLEAGDPRRHHGALRLRPRRARRGA